MYSNVRCVWYNCCKYHHQEFELFEKNSEKFIALKVHQLW